MTDLAIRSADSRLFKTPPPAHPEWGTLTADRMHRPDECVIELHREAPTWLQVVVADINSAALLPYNWDSYGAEPLRRKAALHGLELLQRVDFGGPAPWVAPSPDGGLHLEWSKPGFGLELEISEDGDVEVVFQAGEEITEWRTSVLGDPRLQSALDRVGRGH